MIAPIPFEPLIIKKGLVQKKNCLPKKYSFLFSPTYLPYLAHPTTLSTHFVHLPPLVHRHTINCFSNIFFFLPLSSLLPQRHGLLPLLLLQVSSNSRPEPGDFVVAWELNKNSKALLLCGVVIVA